MKTQVATNYQSRKFLSSTASSICRTVPPLFSPSIEGYFLVGVQQASRAKADGNTLSVYWRFAVRSFEKFKEGSSGRKSGLSRLQDPRNYAGDFERLIRPGPCAKQYSEGATLSSGRARTGNGLIKEAKVRSQKGDFRWAIGVDKDQYRMVSTVAPSQQSYSMMKR